MKERDLLEYLAAKHSQFISDLKFHCKVTAKDIEALDESQFSLKQWNEAGTYLSGRQCRFENISEARQYLKTLVKSRVPMGNRHK